MEFGAGRVASNRNELALMRSDEESGAEPLKHLSGQICQICGDDVGLTADGDLFVACKECAFPVCRPCYEYERKDGNQSCPQCKTRYKRHKGSPRVQGDEEEDEADDLGSEFNYPPPGNGNEKQKIAEAMLHWQMTYGRGEDVGAPTSLRQEIPQPEIPRLTNGQPVSGELPAVSPEHHSIAPPTGGGGGGKRVYPLPYADGAPPVQVRIVDPSREFSSYGFGNVAWKERVDSWKTKQEKNMLQMTNGGQYVSEGKGGDMDGGGGENGEDLPMYAFFPSVLDR